MKITSVINTFRVILHNLGNNDGKKTEPTIIYSYGGEFNIHLD